MTSTRIDTSGAGNTSTRLTSEGLSGEDTLLGSSISDLLDSAVSKLRIRSNGHRGDYAIAALGFDGIMQNSRRETVAEQLVLSTESPIAAGGLSSKVTVSNDSPRSYSAGQAIDWWCADQEFAETIDFLSGKYDALVVADALVSGFVPEELPGIMVELLNRSHGLALVRLLEPGDHPLEQLFFGLLESQIDDSAPDCPVHFGSSQVLQKWLAAVVDAGLTVRNHHTERCVEWGRPSESVEVWMKDLVLPCYRSILPEDRYQSLKAVYAQMAKHWKGKPIEARSWKQHTIELTVSVR